MNAKEFTARYLMHQRKIDGLDANISRLEKLRDEEEAKLAELAVGNSAGLTELRDGQTIESAGALHLVEGDIMADVDGKSRRIAITLFAINAETSQPETLHLSPHPGTDWNYPADSISSNGKEAA